MWGATGIGMGSEPRLGAMFGRYRIESIVGRGGMGVVVRATDLALDRQVALKFLAPELRDDARMRERFLREPRLAAAVEHPSIVPIHRAGEIDGGTEYLIQVGGDRGATGLLDFQAVEQGG